MIHIEFYLGLIVGILVSVLNVFVYTKTAQAKIEKFTKSFSGKAKIVNMEDPLKDIL